MLHCYYKRILSVEVMKYQVSCTDTRTLGVMVGFSIDTTVFEFRDILEKTLASIGLENPNPQRISNSCQEFDIGTIKLLGAFSKPKHMCKRDQNEMICKINKDPQMLLITGVPPFCLSTPPPCTSLQYHMSYRNRA